MVVARPKDGGGTRLREKQDHDEPVSIAANTRFDKADSLQSDNDSSGGSSSGSSSSSSGTSVQSSDRPLRGAVGSASLNISVDDSGEAVETLSSMGSGGSNSTEGVTTEGSTDVASVDASQSVATVEQTEQAVEDATSGRAFGDPNTVEDIGSGDAVTTTTDGPTDASNGGVGLPELPVDPLIIGALTLVAIAVTAGGGA